MKITALMIMSIVAAMSHSGTAETHVHNELETFRSFLLMSEQIEQRGVGGFMTIGADEHCDFDAAVSSIQDVINTNTPEIRVASNGSYQENLTLSNQDVVIRGGFADCTEAENNNQVFTDFAIIDGSGAALPVLQVSGTVARRTVRLENLTLQGGTSVLAQPGGGISLHLADVELQLLRVIIGSNSGSSGAGITVDAGTGINATTTDVFGQDVLIASNDSTPIGVGGGLYCIGDSNITLTGMSYICYNKARFGGGLYMRNGCELNMYSAIHDEMLIFISGIINNQSLEEGGGVYLTLGADLKIYGQALCDDQLCLGSSQVPIHISGNKSDDNDSGQESGGGVYMDSPSFFTEFYANGLVMQDNESGGNAGGVYIGNNSKMTLERLAKPCWNIDRCNLIINNRSSTNIGLGGAFYVDGGALDLSHTYVEENRADFGTAIYASGDSAVVTIEASVFDDNGDEGADGFADNQVLSAALGAVLAIRHTTITDNNAVNSVFNIDPALNSALTLSSSIVHDVSSQQLFGPVSGSLNVNCVVVHEATSFSGNDVLVADPEFIDPGLGNFHLATTSPAIDLCQGIPLLHPLDADMEPRGWDDPTAANTLGAYDAGADESYLSDVIFKNDFE